MDADGVTRVEQPGGGLGVRLVRLAGVFTLGCVALSAWLFYSPVPTAPEEAPPPRVRAKPPTSEPVAAPVRAAPRPSVPGIPAALAERAAAENPTPEQLADALKDTVMEEKSGLALFVPGTKPIKKGIIVPEDFQVPEGYVRHYQTTDDGQMLDAILMFHPDHPPVDANGQPVPVTEDRVVPPELAPPGLPIRMLEVPEGTPGSKP